MLLDERCEEMEKMATLSQKTVYRLSGGDVMGVMDTMDLPEKISMDELEEIISFVSRKLEIPWTEYVEAVIEMYEWRKEEVKE
jgi:hypothetical protein